MSRTVRWVSGVVALAVVLPILAADNPKDKKPDSKEKLLAAGQFIGKLVEVNEEERALTVQVTLYVPVLTGDPDNPYTIEEQQHDWQLKLAEEVKVRTLVLPPVFDDKGYPRKYTAKELKELKGPGNLPGYTAEMGDLKPGQFLRVYLVRKTPVPKPKMPPAPEISMLVILAQPADD